jgi:hypothetical protein
MGILKRGLNILSPEDTLTLTRHGEMERVPELQKVNAVKTDYSGGAEFDSSDTLSGVGRVCPASILLVKIQQLIHHLDQETNPIPSIRGTVHSHQGGHHSRCFNSLTKYPAL